MSPQQIRIHILHLTSNFAKARTTVFVYIALIENDLNGFLSRKYQLWLKCLNRYWDSNCSCPPINEPTKKCATFVNLRYDSLYSSICRSILDQIGFEFNLIFFRTTIQVPMKIIANRKFYDLKRHTILLLITLIRATKWNHPHRRMLHSVYSRKYTYRLHNV